MMMTIQEAEKLTVLVAENKTGYFGVILLITRRSFASTMGWRIAGRQPAHADGPTRFFFSAARGPSLPALPKVSRDRWRQTLPLTVSVLGFNVLQVLLLITLVSSHLLPPHCRYYLLLTTYCLLTVSNVLQLYTTGVTLTLTLTLALTLT